MMLVHLQPEHFPNFTIRTHYNTLGGSMHLYMHMLSKLELKSIIVENMK